MVLLPTAHYLVPRNTMFSLPCAPCESKPVGLLCFFFSSHYDRRSLLQAIKHLKLAFMNSGPMIFVDIINLHLTSPGL